MDASSLLLSLPSSISGAVDFGQRLHYAREFQLESSDAATQFRFLTWQLDNWKRCVGVTVNGELDDEHDEALDDPEILELVEDDLDSIRKHSGKLEKRLLKLGAERSPRRKASNGSRSLSKPEDGRPKSPIPSSKGISWGFGRDKLVWNELESMTRAVESLYKLIPPKASQLEKKVEEKKKAEEERRTQTREVFEWLQVPQIDQQYDVHINARLDGTCGWIFDHDAYRTWTSELDNIGKPKLLWIHGPAGSGKTVLSAALIQQRTKTLEKGHSILYCFCSSFAQARAKFEDIIRIWIWQLVHQNPSAVESVWDEYMNSSEIDRGTVASQTEVWKIWKQLLSASPGCTVIIDGFDEFDRSSRVQSKFLQKIKQVATQTAMDILVTSRNEEDIQHALSLNPRETSEILMLECSVSKELVRKDLDRLASEVIDGQLHSKPDEIKNDLASRLAEKSDGMFLWITQQNLGQLRPGKPLKQLRQIVDKMPSGLKETYRKNWNEINEWNPEDKGRTLAILRLVAFAFRPLTVAEITEALLVKPGHESLSLDELPDDIDDEYIKGEIKGLCGSLIHIRSSGENDVPGSRTLHLAHASVKEFLIDELGSRTTREGSEGGKLAEHHTELAKVCLRYLTYPEIWQPSSTSNQRIPYSFLDYASVCWEKHVLLGEEADQDVSKSLDVIMHLDSPAFHGWRALRIDSDPNLQPPEKEQAKKTRGNPLVWASQFGLKSSVERLLSSSASLIHQREYYGQTALHAVCGVGSLAMVKLLLENGADVNAQSPWKRTPLSCAVLGGNGEHALCLLDAGADINIADDAGCTPLWHACMSGCDELVLLLLEKGADPKIADHDFHSPLYGLCKTGDGDPTPIMRLLEKGADATINLEGAGGATCLHACAEFNRVNLALILLKRGAKASLYTRFNDLTPLHVAASKGHQELIQTFIDQQCDINIETSKNETPLHIAAQQGHLTAVTFLLDNGAHIEATDDLGATPLHLATLNGHLDVIELLLAKGANAKALDKTGWSILHFAAQAGLLGIVTRFVDSGVDPDLASDQAVTPLHTAAANGKLQIVEYLIKKGAQVLAKSVKGSTALHFASTKGHTQMIECLLKHGLDPNSANEEGDTPLLFAAHESPEAVRTLLQHGARSIPSGVTQTNPLHSASRSGNVEIVMAFLEHKLEVDSRDIHGCTPLHHASEKGHVDVVRLLIQHCSNKSTLLESRDFLKETPLVYAARNGHVNVVGYLLDQGADLKVRDPYGWEPLHVAAYYNHLKVAQLLIDRGADPDTSTSQGSRPLHMAVCKGYLDMVQCLLDYGANFSQKDVPAATPLCHGAGQILSDASGATPLHLAAECGHAAVAKALLNGGAELEANDGYGSTPLHVAVANGHVDVVLVLLGHGANVSARDGRGWTPLANAILEQHEGTIRLLLKHKADPTILDFDRRSALHYATSWDNIEVFKLLLEAVSDFDSLTYSLWSPFNLAAQNGNIEMLGAMLDRRPAEYFRPDFEGRNALHMAARGGKLAAFEMLLASGFNPAATDVRGRNILHYASMSSSAELVEKILQLPCSADLLKQYSHFTPLHWAGRSGNAPVISTLVAAGMKETVVKASLLKRTVEWTPLAVAKFSNEGLRLETIDLFGLQDISPEISAGKPYSGFACDSCEGAIIGPRFICRECSFLDYCFMCRADAESLHPGHEFCLLYL